ncbi:putative protein kinase STE-STE11 family [Arabidopsis thaliana]
MHLDNRNQIKIKNPSSDLVFIVHKRVADDKLRRKFRSFSSSGGETQVSREPFRKRSLSLSNENRRREHLSLRIFLRRTHTSSSPSSLSLQNPEKFRMDCMENVGDESLVLIKQGAEARVFESTFAGRRSIVKERFSKKYRHPILDAKLTLKRLNAEARCMTKARKLGVCTPVLYAVDTLLHSLTLEYIEGVSVKDIFLEFGTNGVVEERLDDVAAQIGAAIAKLHDGGLAHGDLTTSNMLVRSGTNQLVLIDFGLSVTSTLPEDKAVDLYVLERALLSMHSSCGNVMDRILTAYRKSSKQWSATFNKLAQDSEGESGL